MHSRCGRCVAASHCAVDHVETRLPLIQPQLEVGTAGSREVLCSPLDVQDAVGSNTTYRGENPKARVYGVQVVPVWEDRVVVVVPRQADVGEGRIGSHKLRIAIGRQVDRGEGLVIQGDREGQCYRGDAVVAMVADVRGAWRDCTGALNYADLAR